MALGELLPEPKPGAMIPVKDVVNKIIELEAVLVFLLYGCYAESHPINS